MKLQVVIHLQFLLICHLYFVQCFQSPHNFTITGKDFAFTFRWETSNQDRRIDVTTTSPIRPRHEQLFTIYRIQEDWNGVEIVKKLIPESGCERIRTTYCDLSKPLMYGNGYSFVVELSNITMSSNTVLPDRILDYRPEGQMTFTKPNFTVTREASKFVITFKKITPDVLEGTTVNQYLQQCGYSPIYIVQYYEIEANTSNNYLPLIHETKISALTPNLTTLTSLRNNATLCVRVRFIDDKITEEYKSPFVKVCVPPPSTTANDQTRSSYTHRWALISISTVFVVVMMMLFLHMCFYDDKKLLRKLFPRYNINIPEKTKEIIEESVKVQLKTAMVCDDDVEDVVDPCSPTETSLEHHSNLKENSLHSNNVFLNKSISPVKLLPDSYSKEDARFDSDQNSSSFTTPKKQTRMIFYENKPGPYVPECKIIIDQSEKDGHVLVDSAVSSPKQIDEINEPASCSIFLYPCDVFKTTVTSGGRKQYKKRYVSEDSAFSEENNFPCELLEPYVGLEQINDVTRFPF